MTLVAVSYLTLLIAIDWSMIYLSLERWVRWGIVYHKYSRIKAMLLASYTDAHYHVLNTKCVFQNVLSTLTIDQPWEQCSKD